MDTEAMQLKREQRGMLFYKVSFFVILLAAIGMIYLLYLVFVPVKVLTLSGDGDVNPNPVKAGDQFSVEVSYCKAMPSRSIIYRHIQRVDTGVVVTPLPLLSSDAPVGCGKFHIHTAVPEYMEPGKYKLVISFQNQANAVRAAYEPYESEEFDVIR